MPIFQVVVTVGQVTHSSLVTADSLLEAVVEDLIAGWADVELEAFSAEITARLVGEES